MRDSKRKGSKQKPWAGRKGETDMGHFSFVAESQPSESSPMTVTYSLWINHSAWLQNAHHFLYPTAVYIGHSSGIILTNNTDIVSKWGKFMCHQHLIVFFIMFLGFGIIYLCTSLENICIICNYVNCSLRL